MPGDIPDDSNAMNIQNAIRLNVNSRATIDPTQHTEIIHIQVSECWNTFQCILWSVNVYNVLEDIASL